MKVCDVMSRGVEVAGAFTSIVAAAKVMRRYGIGFLPVVEDGLPIGVVTDRDIVLRGIGEGRNPHLTSVGDIMTRATIWCYEDEVLTEAARIMEDNHVRRLLVLDEKRRLVGLLSIDDLAAKMSSDRLLGTVVRHVMAVA